MTNNEYEESVKVAIGRAVSCTEYVELIESNLIPNSNLAAVLAKKEDCLEYVTWLYTIDSKCLSHGIYAFNEDEAYNYYQKRIVFGSVASM